MSYAGFYINLDRCPDRRAEMEAEFARFGLGEHYRRFAAIDGNALSLPNPRLNNGEMGCFLSHSMLLKQNLGLDHHLHIVEDDTVFAACTQPVIDRIIESGELDGYDILYTDVSMPLLNEAYKRFKTLYDHIVVRDTTGALQSAAFQILALDRHMATMASSYLVNKRSIDKLCDLYHEELKAGCTLPVDAFLREKADAGVIRAGCVFPFVTSVRVEHTMFSTVRKVPDVTRKFTAANIARYSFFVGCDWEQCQRLLEQLIPLPPLNDPHANILAHVLAFSLLDYTPQDDAEAVKAA